MTTTNNWGGKHRLSFDEYHRVPDRWNIDAILARHNALGGAFPIAAKPRAAMGDWGTNLRGLWYNIADGVRAGDAACVELAVQFIEDHLIISYSGFTRTRLARALRNTSMTSPQKQRLSTQFLKLLETGDRCEEFSEYLRLWPKVLVAQHGSRVHEIAGGKEVAPEFRERLLAMLSSNSALNPTGKKPPTGELER